MGRKKIRSDSDTRARSVRVPDADWDRWREYAESNGVSLSDLIRVAVNNACDINLLSLSNKALAARETLAAYMERRLAR